MFLKQRENLCRNEFCGVHHSAANSHGKQGENGETKGMKLGKDSEDAVFRSKFCGPHGLAHIGTQVAVGEFYPFWLSGSARCIQQGGYFIWGWPGGQDAVPKATRQVFQENCPDPRRRRAEHLHHWSNGDAGIGAAVGKNVGPVIFGNQEVEGNNAPTRSPNAQHGQWSETGCRQHESGGRGASQCIELPGQGSAPGKQLNILPRPLIVSQRRPKRTLAQSFEELGSNQQLEGSVSGQGGIRTRGRG